MALPVKALHVGQEDYWLDQIAKDREEYFSGKGESPGRFVGDAAQASGLAGEATAEQVRALARGLDPATGEVRCKPLWRADPRSKLSAAPLLAALKQRAAEQGAEQLDTLAGSKALAGDVRSVQAACRPGASGRVKVETVERLCRKVLQVDPHELYGEHFDRAWQHKGKRVDGRVAMFDHCFNSPKSVSLLAAGGGERIRREVAAARAEALQVPIAYLQRHGIGVRRDHNGTDRHRAVGGLLGIAFEHRISRAGDPHSHTHVLVQNAAQGPDGRWTALDSDRLYAHLMAADHLYLAAERAALTERLGVRWGPVDAHSGAAEIVGLDDRALIERFSKRSEQIDQWLTEQGLSGIKASSAAAVATRAPKDHSESEQSVYQRWARELAEQGVGERQLAEACRGGRGRPASEREVRQVLEQLAGPEGLTEQASTFIRADVVDALAKRLPVARSAEAALTQAEALADRFLAERSVRVGRDQRLDADRYSTPELLEVERKLVTAATGRRNERCAQVRPDVVRQVLDRHPTAGEDQAAMVQDVTCSGAGVVLVVGRAGSGKTWTLGLAREAFQLDGYRVLGCAPTGIATVGLGEEGFSDLRTVDRLLLDLGRNKAELDARTVLVVDEAAMLGTRKLAPLLEHAQRAGSKVILVGDDRQFAAIQAGGGFRALRLRLGASELTENRRQVQAWEQRAIEDVRAGRVEEAICAYAEHDRVQAFDIRDDRDRAVLADWWQAHQAGQQPVIYAHRRLQVDQLNRASQRLRAEHGQLGLERLAVGDLQVAVGDQVVLGANALERLGVANGTSVEITGLDTRRRTLTVRTLDDEQPKTVTLPRWYLDGEVRPGQSRRVDLAYARTDMRSQGRTEQRALLALDGKEDMQGFYVQVTRSIERTDLYLTVGPEPLEEAHPHPAGERLEPERLLGRVMTRDSGKTIAADLPLMLDVRRLSTRQLRDRRDQLAALRASCPSDRSREFQRARERAADLEQARRAAQAEHQVATGALAAAGGRLLHRRDWAAARDRLTLAQHALKTVTGQAEQATERLGLLRRAEQERAGWLEQHQELPVLERINARELAWRQRVDERAVALTQPGWLVEVLGPMPGVERPAEQRAWLATAVALDGYRRAYGLDDQPLAKHGGASAPGRDERLHRPRPAGRAGELPSTPPPAANSRCGTRPGGAGRAGGAPRVSGPTAPNGRPLRRAARQQSRSCWAPSQAAARRAAAATGSRSRPLWSGLSASAPATLTATTIASPTATTDPAASSAATGGRSGSTSTEGAQHAQPTLPPSRPRPRRPGRWRPRPLERWRPRGRPRGPGARHGGVRGDRAVGAGPHRRGAGPLPGRPRWPARPAARQRLGHPPTARPADRGSPSGCPGPSRLGRPRVAGAAARRAAPGSARRVRQPRPLRPGHLPAAARRRAGRLGPHGRLASRRHHRRRRARNRPGAGGRLGPPGAAGRGGRRHPGCGLRLRFRVSRDGRAWRDGARGERATARLLRRLGRHGYVVFHDVAIPGTPANADHLLIGPPGAILIDSKRYAGQVTQGRDGRVWHNHYPMDQTLRALRLETQAISTVLGVRVRPVICIHCAQVAHGGLHAGDVEILPARRLRSMLRTSG